MKISNRINRWLRKYIYGFLGMSKNDFLAICFIALILTNLGPAFTILTFLMLGFLIYAMLISGDKPDKMNK